MNKYIVLRNIEAGQYIPTHDPSFVHDNLEDAVREANYDLDHGADSMVVYQAIQVISNVTSS